MIIKCLILDDDTLLRNCVEETFYYSENKLLPVYKMGLTKGVSTDKVAEILINGCSDPSKIATLVPTAVEKNVVLIVKTTALGHLDDIKCDDLGSWLQKERKECTKDQQSRRSTW